MACENYYKGAPCDTDHAVERRGRGIAENGPNSPNQND